MVLFGQKNKIKFSQLLAGSSKKLSRHASKSATPLCKHLIFDLIIVKHVVEGIAELIRHLLDLELFPVDLVLNVINPKVKENIKHCYSKTLLEIYRNPKEKRFFLNPVRDS